MISLPILDAGFRMAMALPKAGFSVARFQAAAWPR
jgi:hypothetical protein